MAFVHCRSTWSRRGPIAVVLAATLALGIMPSAQSATISATKAYIAKLSSQLAAEEAKSEALAQKYDGVLGQLQALNTSITKLRHQVNEKQHLIDKTTKELVSSLIRTYVDGSAATQSLPLFNQNVSESDARRVYENEANGNLQQIELQLKSQEASLHRSLVKLNGQRTKAADYASQLRLLIAQNNSIVAETQSTLTTVTRALAHKIIRYEISVAVAAALRHDSTAVEQAVAAASAVGGTTAANRVIAAVAAVSRSTGVSGSPAGSKQGLKAVRAAESQIGVPYVWGGESPGLGFDCSGLTQWSWGRAGYSIPRTAAEQYYGMRHVLLNQLRPGDLLFYYNLDSDHQIDHVVMYVGSGPFGANTIIAAAHTGTTVGFEPLFTYGLYGAGRP